MTIRARLYRISILCVAMLISGGVVSAHTPDRRHHHSILRKDSEKRSHVFHPRLSKTRLAKRHPSSTRSYRRAHSLTPSHQMRLLQHASNELPTARNALICHIVEKVHATSDCASGAKDGKQLTCRLIFSCDVPMERAFLQRQRPVLTPTADQDPASMLSEETAQNIGSAIDIEPNQSGKIGARFGTGTKIESTSITLLRTAQ